jgi:hypothetical protein
VPNIFVSIAHFSSIPVAYGRGDTPRDLNAVSLIVASYQRSSNIRALQYDPYVAKGWEKDLQGLLFEGCEASNGLTGNYSGPEVRLKEMWSCGVLFAVQSPRTPFLANFRFADDTQNRRMLSNVPHRL